MSETNDKTTGGDTHANLSVAPYEKAVDTATKGAVEAASAFLSKTCLPALAELGGMLEDRVSYWRKCQALKLIQKWEARVKELGTEDYHAPPRLIETGLERGSLVDSEELSDMWAGLLASSCTPDGSDDSNLLFMNILDQLTIPQAKIIRYAVEHSEKKISADGLVYAEELSVDLATLIEISSIGDVERLDRELDHLRSIQMITTGFPLILHVTTGESSGKPPVADITPCALAIHFYVRCQGTLKTVTEYFGIKYEPPAIT